MREAVRRGLVKGREAEALQAEITLFEMHFPGGDPRRPEGRPLKRKPKKPGLFRRP